jgi:catechol 2,3-dioxygenase-like lactoylglutathione lyase family enzyme
VNDLGQARVWYSDKLGLEPSEERPGGLRYQCAGSEFVLFESAGAASGDHTQMAFDVDDFDAVVAELQERGVSFDEYGITEVQGNYPSKGGKGEKAAWFRDPDGNLFGIGQAIR